MNPEPPAPTDLGPRQPAAADQPPIATTQEPPYRPIVTYAILGVTIAVFIAQIGSQFRFGQDLPAFYGQKNNALIALGQYWRLITPMFLHSTTNFLHIAFNMYALFLFGPGLERRFGRGRFVALYGVSGFAGNVFSMIFSRAPSLGSSTAIFGLLGAHAVYFYQNREVLGPMARNALRSIVMLAAINLIIGLAPQIDNWGHIGGLIGGSLFTWFGGPLLRVQGIFPARTTFDERTPEDVFRAGLAVGLLFILIALLTIYLRQ